MAAASKSLYAALQAGGTESGRKEEKLPGPRRGRETPADVSTDLSEERRKRN